MMSIAISKGSYFLVIIPLMLKNTITDWNTATDEDAIPQLKKISCTALACYLHHCGLAHFALTHTAKPTRNLIEVYRGVFSLRKEVFLHRPIPGGDGMVRCYCVYCTCVYVTVIQLQCTCTCVYVIMYACTCICFMYNRISCIM